MIGLESEIIRMAVEDRVPVRALARHYGLGRMQVWRFLKRHGIDTSRFRSHVHMTCAWCGKPIQVYRCRMKDRRLHFCGMKCRDSRRRSDNEARLAEHFRRVVIRIQEGDGT